MSRIALSFWSFGELSVSASTSNGRIEKRSIANQLRR